MDFNFGGFAEIQEPSSGNSLKPWNIYNEVNFGGVSTKQSGTRKDGTPWNAWDFTFNAKEGSYSERIFEPLNDNDTEYNGKKIPSDFKRTQQFVVQVLSAYNPERGLSELRVDIECVVTGEPSTTNNKYLTNWNQDFRKMNYRDKLLFKQINQDSN